jgi:alkylated DNA repair dioxygenase AlkB
VQADLFGIASVLPDGYVLREEFIAADEEAALLDAIAALELHEATYKGYTARRRIANFGTRYDFDDLRLLPAEPIPAFLLPLRDRAAGWAGVPPEALSSALVAEYRPGTPLGWHRDVPEHEIIFGVSLGGPARMRLRPYPPVAPKKADVINVDLAPRSAYLLRDAARWRWQHSIAPTEALRHSITLRTRRVPSAPSPAGGGPG